MGVLFVAVAEVEGGLKEGKEPSSSAPLNTGFPRVPPSHSTKPWVDCLEVVQVLSSEEKEQEHGLCLALLG
jgi:hypothetical protein